MSLERYEDGRWTVGDHPPDRTASLWCRGNVGEVFPNVVTPLSASLYRGAMDRGQAAAALEWGLVTKKQFAASGPGDAWLTGVFGGYLYGNVTAARAAVARSPGLTIELVDEQMFGLHGAPPHARGRGERDPRAAVTAMAHIARSMLRPDDTRLRNDQADIATYVRSQPDIASGSDAELIAVARTMPPWAERMMHHLLSTSSAAGISRSLLERIVASLDEPGLENRLTAGLGTVESAEPARDLWMLGRTVAADARLGEAFDDGVEDLDARLRATREADGFVAALDAFRAAHGSRGPDEWELASPTWGSDPAIALAMVDRLRHAPDDRDPGAVGERLASEREALAIEVGERLGWRRRRLFDIALRATVAYAPQREATKAAFVRVMGPTRRALAELAHRSRFSHADFFLLTIDEVAAAVMEGGGPSDDVIRERRDRRDALQARVPPFWFVSPLPSPDSWALRHESGAVNTAVTAAATERQIVGMGVCSGVATGTARIVLQPDRPGDLGPGDILVAPITDPAWTPLFLAAAGIVVDVGAQQSHAAIVSRELGIPAVVSATGASATIPDGALVTVDGSTGLVTIHGPRAV